MKRVLTVFMTCFAVCIVILMGCDDTATNPQEETTKMALVYPEGGETFSIGDTVTISFKANGDSISSIGIQVTFMLLIKVFQLPQAAYKPIHNNGTSVMKRSMIRRYYMRPSILRRASILNGRVK